MPESATRLVSLHDVDARPIRKGSLVRVHPSRRADAQDLFFVATRQGGHHFSRTLAEHDVHLRKYIRQLRRDQRAAEAHSGGPRQ